MIPYKQLTLAEVFEDCQNKFDNDKYQFLSLLDQTINLDERPDILLKLLKFQSFELPLHICFIHSWRFRQNINIKNHSDSDMDLYDFLYTAD